MGHVGPLPGARIQEEEQTVSFPKGKRKKKWTGWKPKTDEQTSEFGKKVMEGGEDKIEEDSAVVNKTLRLPLVKWRITQKLKEENFSESAGECEIREEAAARCTKKIRRKVLKKQARKETAEHLLKCCLEPGKKKVKRNR